MIKKLIFLATFVASILFFSTVVGANEQKQKDIYWKIGDAIRSIIVCKTEKDILEIGYADTQSMLQMNQLIQIKLMQGSCMAFNHPLHLEIEFIIGDYNSSLCPWFVIRK